MFRPGEFADRNVGGGGRRRERIGRRRYCNMQPASVCRFLFTRVGWIPEGKSGRLGCYSPVIPLFDWLATSVEVAGPLIR